MDLVQETSIAESLKRPKTCSVCGSLLVPEYTGATATYVCMNCPINSPPS